jgi:hypothetical protein
MNSKYRNDNSNVVAGKLERRGNCSRYIGKDFVNHKSLVPCGRMSI